MRSNITETATTITISSPKQKSWVLIVILSLIILQFTNGIVQTFRHWPELSSGFQGFVLIISSLIVFFAMREVLWQLMGRYELEMSSEKLIYSRKSPLRKKMVSRSLNGLSAIEVQDQSQAEGPMAILQLLRIVDRVKLNMILDHTNICVLSGLDLVEAKEIQRRLELKWKAPQS